MKQWYHEETRLYNAERLDQRLDVLVMDGGGEDWTQYQPSLQSKILPTVNNKTIAHTKVQVLTDNVRAFFLTKI